MAKTFDAIAKTIANEYVNNILFIDEQAFFQTNAQVANNKQKALDVEAVSRAFSKAGKICGFYAPKTLDDIENCKSLVLKPDIVILDWDIQINRSFSKDEESQDDDTDVLGYYSIELIKTIVSDAKDEKFKVVFVYTGEPELNGIIDIISDSLGEGFIADDKQFVVVSDNIHIIVRLKPNSKVDYVGLRDLIVSYEDLPDTVITTFAKYVCGLVPCFAMKSLAAVRDSAAKVLTVYSNELDAELLGHQMALPNPDDVKEYLADSFGDAIKDLIMGMESINTDLWVNEWLSSKLSSDRQIDIANKQIIATSANVSSFFNDRYDKRKIVERYNASFSANCAKNKEKELLSRLSEVFRVEGMDANRARFLFAALSHHKNLLLSNTFVPSLTLGSILFDSDKKEYFICIQQRCDTKRVPADGRRFVFLPLSKEKKGNLIGAIAIAPGDILYLKKSSCNAISFVFKPDDDGQPIRAKVVNGRYVFESSERRFEWKSELKEIIAQRIVTEFTSHFARVGVNEAEWLRIEGTNTD